MKRSDLSPDQLKVYQSMLDWVRTPSSRLLTVGGYGGTGKSTLLGVFAEEHRHMRIAYVCFTGRASSIVSRKLTENGVETTNLSFSDDDRKLSGRSAQYYYGKDSPKVKLPFCGTIHRLLYKAVINDHTEELLGWQRRMELDRNYDLVVIDEASMIDAKMVADIQEHGVRILAVGDHGQLPPVMSDGSLIQRPMLRLEKIHRQAEGSPIIRLSRAIREEGRMARELDDGNRLRFGDRSHITHPRLAELLQAHGLGAAVLCWRNATRVHVNRTVRANLGHAGKPPQVGEPLIALRNYAPVYNGMRGLVTKECTFPFKNDPWLMKTEIEFPDEGLPPREHEVCRDQFHRARPFDSLDDVKAAGMNVFSMSGAGEFFDFGYAMTVHKCLEPNTLIETPSGLIRAKNLPPTGIVSTPNGRAKYRELVKYPNSKILRIFTEDGYELRVTPDHGIDAWNVDKGYARKEAKHIREGDILRLRLGAEFTGEYFSALPPGRHQDVRAKKYNLPSVCTEDVAEFLGLMVADGTVYKRGFRLAKRHEDVANRFDELCRSLFGAEPSRFFKLGAHHVEVSSTLIAAWLLDVGGMKPEGKNVPDCILSSHLGVQAKFLRGLFEDGTVNVKSEILDHVEFSSTVPDLLRTVRVMLLRFGIVAGKAKSRFTSIYIYGGYAKTFGEQIGFVSSFKQLRLENSKIPDGTRYFYPLLREELYLSEADRGLIQRHRVPPNLADRFLDREPFHHSRVTKIIPWHETVESVCVEVPRGNQFIQDGFCGWNSQGSQFKHAIVVADWRADYSQENTRRLAYTAVTRAQEKLTVLT